MGPNGLGDGPPTRLAPCRAWRAHWAGAGHRRRAQRLGNTFVHRIVVSQGYLRESRRAARLPAENAGGDKLSAITYREGDPYRDLVKFLGAVQLPSPLHRKQVGSDAQPDAAAPDWTQGRTARRARPSRSASLWTASPRRIARWDSTQVCKRGGRGEATRRIAEAPETAFDWDCGTRAPPDRLVRPASVLPPLRFECASCGARTSTRMTATCSLVRNPYRASQASSRAPGAPPCECCGSWAFHRPGLSAAHARRSVRPL